MAGGGCSNACLTRFINLALLAIIAVVCAVVESILEHRDSKRGAYWFIGDDRSGDNPNVNGLVTLGYVPQLALLVNLI